MILGMLVAIKGLTLIEFRSLARELSQAEKLRIPDN
jgi:hypothetical protein